MSCNPLVVSACVLYETYECRNRCCRRGSEDSIEWPLAKNEDVTDIRRQCCRILGAYGQDADEIVSLVSSHDDGFSREMVVAVEPTNIAEKIYSPPYYISCDKKMEEVGIYFRGMRFGGRADYGTVLQSIHGGQAFGGGLVHSGVFRAAKSAFDKSSPLIGKLLEQNPRYKFIIGGHSLGAGVASLFTLLSAKNSSGVKGIERSKIKCIAVAYPRVMSSNLAQQHADLISCVIFQDDFLPRSTLSSAQHVLVAAVACTGVVLFHNCVQQLFCPSDMEETHEKDLLIPGRVFHVVYKKGKCSSMPVEVRVGVPMGDRFDKLVLSCSAAGADHSLLRLIQYLEMYKPPDAGS